MRTVAAGVLLAVFSHLCASFFPFAAKGVISSLGYFSAVLVFYLIGSMVCLAVVFIRAPRRLEAKQALSALVRLWSVKVIVLTAVGSALAYYAGLYATSDLAAYIFATRLDWILQLIVGVTLMREGFSRFGMLGAFLAICGGLLLAWERLSAEVLLAAAIYVLFTVVSHSYARRVLAKGIVTAFGLLLLRNLTVSFGLLVWWAVSFFLALTSSAGISAPLPAFELWLAIGAGLLLLSLFWLRFAALERVPIWLYAAFAPIQPLMTVVFLFLLSEVVFSPVLFVGILLVVLGELLCALAEIKCRPGVRAFGGSRISLAVKSVFLLSR